MNYCIRLSVPALIYGLVLLVPSIITAQTAVPIPTLFNTGVSSNNSDGSPATLTADGATDPHYAIVAGVDGAISPYVTKTGAYPFLYWSLDTTNSKWISPQATYAGLLQDPVGSYTYRTTFDLTGIKTNTLSISGQLAADNAITAVRINGFDFGYSQSANDQILHPFSLPNGHYVSGVNTLEIDVLNYSPDGGNPSGLRAEFTASANLPLLTIGGLGNNVILTWPTNYTGFTLQSTTNLVPPAAWTAVSPAPVVVNTNFTVTNAASSAQMLYRLTQ